MPYQTYQGYFQDGRFVSPDSVSIPDNSLVMVTVVDDQLPVFKTRGQQQVEALDQFILSIKAIDNEPLTEDDYAALENNRANLSREISL
jgi:hypothetical protein